MKRSDIILQLAPCFRDRFDFSVPEDYKKWLEMTAAASEPFVNLYADEEIAHRTALARIKELEAKLEAKK